jgi:Na+/phosphate symporter
MADVVDDMLKTSASAMASDDVSCVAAIRRADDVLDSLYDQIQLYVGAIAHEALSEHDERRLSALLALAINLEHIGDIVEKNLMQMAGKRIRDRRRLPGATLASLSDMHERLRNHLRLAVTVFISQDEATARRLVREKEDLPRARARGDRGPSRRDPQGRPRGPGPERPAARHHPRPEAHRGAYRGNRARPAGASRTAPGDAPAQRRRVSAP